MIEYRDGWIETYTDRPLAEPPMKKVSVPVKICDCCFKEVDVLWKFLGDELCEDCLLEAAKEYEGEVIL